LIRKRASADSGFCGGCRVPACAFDRFSCACYRLLPVAALPAERSTRFASPHNLIARPDLHFIRANDRTVVLYRVSRSNPLAAFSAAALPTSHYAHRPRFRKMVRLTGEACRPVSGELVCRLCEVGSSLSALRRTSQSINSGVHGDATVTGRFRDWKLVVSVE
jgi:hypothetical protein